MNQFLRGLYIVWKYEGTKDFVIYICIYNNDKTSLSQSLFNQLYYFVITIIHKTMISFLIGYAYTLCLKCPK